MHHPGRVLPPTPHPERHESHYAGPGGAKQDAGDDQHQTEQFTRGPRRPARGEFHRHRRTPARAHQQVSTR
jgi:hypothetical protein